MQEKRNPKWWRTEYDSSWERVKAAFKRDWDQTKHDIGSRQPDTDQNVGDTGIPAVPGHYSLNMGPGIHANIQVTQIPNR